MSNIQPGSRIALSNNDVMSSAQQDALEETLKEAVTMKLPDEAIEVEHLRERLRAVYSKTYAVLTAEERVYFQSAMIHMTSAAASLDGRGLSKRK